MTKEEFISFIAEQEKIINIFTKSVTNVLSKKEELNLIGFGSFYVSKVEDTQVLENH